MTLFLTADEVAELTGYRIALRAKSEMRHTLFAATVENTKRAVERAERAERERDAMHALLKEAFDESHAKGFHMMGYDWARQVAEVLGEKL